CPVVGARIASSLFSVVHVRPHQNRNPWRQQPSADSTLRPSEESITEVKSRRHSPCSHLCLVKEKRPKDVAVDGGLGLLESGRVTVRGH
ncbi:unnamed protein product, partial [Musa hybrid cultivar]